MRKIAMAVALVVAAWANTPFVLAQNSNQIWFVSYNGQPTPSADVSVQMVSTGGNATTIAAGSAVNFVSQTNFPSFNSPFDIAVDAGMGKVYVLDNNVEGVTNEYIYSFDLSGTPAQIAASAQIIYTMPVPQADVSSNLYPLVSGIALDPINHYLYFNQMDYTTGTNSYIGCISLASSSESDAFSTNNDTPALQTYYTGLVPGQGPIGLDSTNIYLGAINSRNGNDGVFTAPVSGSGGFTEIVALSTNDTTFPNGFIGGVASSPANHLVYYLTYNAGIVNFNFSTNQNALWAYNTLTRARTKIASGYKGYPDNIALDLSNSRYYFTLGRDGTGSGIPGNYQAIYTGTIGTTNAPTLFYTPLLSGQDVAGQPNAGNVALQGIFVQSTALPLLTIQPNFAGLNLSSVVLTWPSYAVGFTPQQNASLATPYTWSNCTGTVTANGTNQSLTVTPTGQLFLTGNLFFRLWQP